MTREQAATFLYRYVATYLGQTPVSGANLADFRDGALRARTSLTRAQMAKLLTILDQDF